MKKIFKYTLLAAFIVVAAGCKKEDSFTDKNGDVRIYMSQAVSGQFQEITVSRRAPLQSDTSYVFDVNAFFAGSGYLNAPEDVKVSFAVDYSKWDSINTARVNAGKPAYEKIPDNIFSFSNTSSVIKKGTSISENTGFAINGKQITEGHNYMIPVSISEVGGNFPVNRTLATTYFVVKVTPPVYPEMDRSAWTIYAVDSEEASGEGPDNGRAIFALDGKLNTFWHTQWDGGEPPLPHHIAIDMKATKTLSGLYLTARQNAPNGAPKTVVVDVSPNGTTWQNAGTYQLQVTNAKQSVFFSQAYSVRYFRVTVTATNGNTNITFFAEISAF
ncbi:uncharacterized protein DUF1735 [Arcticibacter tournemirensis]|uniref:DUF1735 domain-containing protein n=1 Tax=Arcticibacter tournemirensis TaxID=699437 RepID=A0A5M9GLH4_9SPHI|nr:discoidin domain-containing protein [Arcticibacter tournemirensis]KAA8475416.1 DUF1735 domain-containing protein [Arcticibacter tournemirensis]TQM49916.1 uncharacterized protein DUF1735 [Arcticibacter tournemirensis]